MITRRNLLDTLAAGMPAVLFASPLALQAEEMVALGQGMFQGASGHATSGSAAILVKDGKHFVSLGRDFVFDGAPDPKVALGRDGYRREGLLGALEGNSGAQSYEIPAELDPHDFNEVWIWCEQFNVPLGLAKLT